MNQLPTCRAAWDGAILTLENALFRRQYGFFDGKLRAISFRTSNPDRDWIAPTFAAPAPREAHFSLRETDGFPVGAPCLEVELQSADFCAQFRVWEGVAGCAFRVSALAVETAPAPGSETEKPTGIERDEATVVAESKNAPLESFALPAGHFQLVEAGLRDQSDMQTELCVSRVWTLLPPETSLELGGVAFRVDDLASGAGLLFFKHAPLPTARAEAEETDFRVSLWRHLELRDGGYWCATIATENGVWGRCEQIQRYSRAWRAPQTGRDGLLLSNTWGDRGRDAHLSPAFMEREIEAGARLGIEIIQIDDGWEAGVTANSALSNGQGVWSGFWNSNPNFWGVNLDRFPDGLENLRAHAAKRGLKLGLWFAPDCSNEGENWARDAEVLLRLHREEGADFFKIDGLKLENAPNQARLEQFFEQVLRESAGKITFDLDITAEKRFGPLGLMEPGPLFVQNRYTDWARYHPHLTLRVLWTLSHWLDPLRLRLEWLNHARNDEKYGDDALRPSQWLPDALFATVLLASPLAWFEVQNLPESYFQIAAPLIATWKSERAALHTATVVPLGTAPDGFAWTGFWARNDHGASFALVFREANPSATWQIELPAAIGGAVSVLGGRGKARVENGRLHVEIEAPLDFLWLKFESASSA